MDGFSFWQEVAKEVVGTGGAAIILLLGALVGLRVNSLQRQSEAREKYLVETLATAYQRIERCINRPPNWYQANGELALKARLEFESAIADIQLLADRTNAEKAAAYCQAPGDEGLLIDLVISLRRELRARLGLKPVEINPHSSRLFTEADIKGMSEEHAALFGEAVHAAWRRLHATPPSGAS